MKFRRIFATFFNLFFALALISNPVLGATSTGGDQHPAAAKMAVPNEAVQAVEGDNTASPAGVSDEEWQSMQAMMRAADYQFSRQIRAGQWAYRAPNHQNGLDLAFAPHGLTASRYTTAGELAWDVGLSLVAYGDQPLSALREAPALSAHKERVEYRWSDALSEWYHNTPAGLEHGLTLNAPPPTAGTGPVRLSYAWRGSLIPELDESRQIVRLRDAADTVALLYDTLQVFDATGQRLPAHFELAGGGLLRIVIDATNAAYPLTVDPLLHSETAVLRASDAQGGDRFGRSVAVSGDTVVVGAYLESGGAGDPNIEAGAAYVFERNQGGADTWGEVTILRASDTQERDHFGVSVGISGDTVVVGANTEDGGDGNPHADAGAAYVFERNQGGTDNWGEVTILHASDAQLDDYFGFAVAISGDTVVVGAYGEDGGAGDPITEAGAAYVYERNQGGADNWGEVTILHASDAQGGDYFGGSVSISGDTAVVGAYYEDGGTGDPLDGTGAAYVFTRNQGGADKWGQVQILRASDAQAGDTFGESVAISGDTVVVGAGTEEGGAGDPLYHAGAAYVYERNQGGADNWGEVTILRASDAQVGDTFGGSVSISGDTVVVGADLEDGGAGDPIGGAGAAYVYARNQGGADNWGQVQILRASDAQVDDDFGYSVAVSGATVVVGALLEDGGTGNPLNYAGAAYLFTLEDGVWREVSKTIASDTQIGDAFGKSVSISGDTIVVGAWKEDGGAGNPAGDAGAAYVFTRNQDGADNWGEVQILRASDAQASDQFGYSVAVSGDTIVVGADLEDGGAGNPAGDAGAAYVFTRNQGGADNWGEVQILRASDVQAGDQFGYAVSISGDTVVVGANVEDGGAGDPITEAGAAYVFGRNQGGADNWGQVQILRASDAQASDHFGTSVATSGDTVVVGANVEDGGAGDPASDAGAAYVFERNQGGADNWGQVQILRASDAQTDDYFGGSVAVSGDTVVVGASGEDGGAGDPASGAGAAYIFGRNQGGADNWGEVQILHASDAQADDWFGLSVAISGDTVVVGAYAEDGGAGNPLTNAGAAYVFERNQGGADNWDQVQILRASDAQASDYFGRSVSVSENTIVVGVPYEDGGGSPSSDAGAAYVFSLAALLPPDLALTKTVSPAAALPAAPITYTLTFSNAGQETATGVIITDVVPVSVTNVSVISNGVVITDTGASPAYVWQVQDLASGEGGVITITGVLSNPLALGVFTNTATITTTSVESDTDNNSAEAGVTVQNLLPPTLLYPPDGTMTKTTTLSLTWQASPSLDVVGYLLDWDGAVINVGNVTDYMVGPLSTGVYTWTAAAYDVVNNTSPYTDTWAIWVCEEVDPTQSWHTFHGSAVEDSFTAMTTDVCGNVYVVGSAAAAWSGSPVNGYIGSGDVVVAKFNGNGGLEWHTFLGSSGLDDGWGIEVDHLGNVFVAGTSDTAWGSPVRAHQGSNDTFLAKLNNDGNLQWHTFVGAGGDEIGYALALSQDGSNVCVGGWTTSDWGGTPKRSYTGGDDAFVAKLSSDTGLQSWHTFLGSGQKDETRALATDSSGNVYVTGYSNDTWGSPVDAYTGSSDAFVAKLNSSGVLQWHTLMGSNGLDYGLDVAAGETGSVYVTGESDSSWGSPLQAHQGNWDILVVKLNAGTGARTWHTFIGSDSADEGFALALDANENVHVTGSGYATWGNPESPYNGNSDIFAARLASDGVLHWNTFLGSTNVDFGRAVAITADWNFYLAGSSQATWGAPLNPYTGGADGLVAKVALPDVQISKTAPVKVGVGNPLTYTLTITNRSPFALTNLVITDTLPSGVDYVSGGTKVGNVVSLTLGSLAANDGVAHPTFIVAATNAATDVVVNNDYHVRSAEGYSASSSQPVATAILHSPVLLSPPNNHISNDTTPILSWQPGPSPDVTGYLLNWNGVISDVGNVMEITLPTQVSGVYTWTVAAHDVNYIRAYTEVWSLEVDIYHPEVIAVTPSEPITTGENTVYIPANILPSEVTTMTFTRLETPTYGTGQPDNFADIAFELNMYDSVGQPITSFASPISITIRYDENQLPTGVTEDQLAVYYRDSGGTWVQIAETDLARDPDNDLIIVTLDHLTEFMLAGGGKSNVYLPIILKNN